MADIILTLPTQLRYNNEHGDPVTQLPLPDYVLHLADVLATLTDTVASHTTAIASLVTSVATINTTLGTSPTPPTVTAPEIMGDGDPHELPATIHEISTQFGLLKGKTGTTADMQDGINAMGSTLANKKALSNSGIMSGISGWVSSPDSVGDSIKNAWLAINDIREAMYSLIPAPSDCSGLIVGFTAVHNPAANELVLNFYGHSTIPVGTTQNSLVDTYIVISDSTNDYYVSINTVLSYISSATTVHISLASSGLNPNIDYTLVTHYSFLRTGGATCNGTSSTITVTNLSTKCLSISVTPFSDHALISMVSIATQITSYRIKVYKDSTDTLVKDQTYVGYSSTFSDDITGLDDTTYYRIEPITIIGTTEYPCANVYFTTTIS